MVYEMCPKFADEELSPNAGRWDKEHAFPTDAVDKLVRARASFFFLVLVLVFFFRWWRTGGGFEERRRGEGRGSGRWEVRGGAR
jgi:hypothetical protein